jgi:NADPH-dependent curcumin reductase CurA
MTRTNRQWRLASRPVGEIKPGDLEFTEEPVRALEDGEVLVRNIYLSLDPTNRIWMSDMDQYMPPVEVGDVMRGGTIGVVEESKFEGLAPGDIVLPGLGNWQDYFIGPGEMMNKVPGGTGLPLPAFMSAVGMTGATAYFGLLEIGQPQPSETVVVSAAAGAVGSIVGQIAKIKGARVVGIAGSDEKCKWLTDELGFDAAINYKTENLLESLKKHCPDGIDVYFENVGGKTLDAVLTLVNNNARIPLCGLIDSYNATKPVPGPYMFANILMHRVTLKGFIIIDYLPRMAEAVMTLAGWVLEGKIKYKVDVVDGLENAPTALKKLFTGENKGKLLVQVSPEPDLG